MYRGMKKQRHPQQSSRELFDDDPEKLMGLPPLEKISEFWKRYDRLADITDEKMTSDLSENLDVLLIFAALFSAINTAFIALTMPTLSSDPSAETNTLLRLLVNVTIAANNMTHMPVPADPPAFSPSSNSVISNCLLYASLTCSLLAAVGAMMAKEWLQSFDRTGQTGPLEEQGRFRQRKYDGVQRWHLESIIQSLPNLLLLSVMLFFAGVYLFLLAVNKVVAIVVIAFFGGGAILCGVTIVMGAISPLCPYKSAASRALGCTRFLFSLQWWKRLLRTFIDLTVVKPSRFILKIPDVVRLQYRWRDISTGLDLVHNGFAPTLHESGAHEEAVAAQAARWLLETTSNRADQVAAAQFICTLNSTARAPAVDHPNTWQNLVSLTREAFDTWHSQPNTRNREVAELFGLASCRILLRFSNDTDKRKGLTDLLLYQPRSFGGTFWQAFQFASTTYPYYVSRDAEYVLHVAFFATILSTGPVIPEYRWHEVSKFFPTGTHFKVDVLLGMWAICLCDVGSDRSRSNGSRAMADLMKVGEENSVLVERLWDAIASGTRALPLVRGDLQFELNTARGYRYCLRRALELSPQILFWGPGRTAHRVADLMLSFIGPLASSDSGKSSSELARLSVEAVFALHGLIMPNPCANRVSVCQPEQLLNGRLVDAVVGLMLNSLKVLTSPERVRERVGERVRREWLERREEREALERLEWLERLRRVERVERVERQVREEREERRERQERRERERERERQRLEGAPALERWRERALERALEREPGWGAVALEEALDRGLRLLVESCLIRILLQAWKTTPVTLLDPSSSRIFTSSCRLWAPLEATVNLTKNGIKMGDTGDLFEGFNDDNQDKLLTSNDLETIVEFVEYLQKNREKSAFIARNADVGINRLYVHLDRREKWDYELYDLREPRSLCSRSIAAFSVAFCI